MKQIGITPTGKNGYEEYIRAAEIASDPLFGMYDRWTPAMRDQPDAYVPEEPLPPDQLQLYKHLASMRLLEVRQEQLRRYAGVLDLVRQGSLKPVFDPRQDLNPESLYPELTYFRRLARLFSADAYVKFAEGKSAAATKSLLDGLEFSYNIGSGMIISALVGIANTAVVLSQFEDHLGSLSLDDCRNIRQATQRLLAAPIPIAAAIATEAKASPKFVNWIFENVDQGLAKLIEAPESQKQALVQRAEQASAQDKERWRREAVAKLGVFYEEILRRFKLPESQWVDSDSMTPPDSDDPIVKAIVAGMSPVFSGAMVPTVRIRTQLRLLALHAAIQEFRWMNGRLPRNLAELEAPALVYDPLTLSSFLFESTGYGYRLYSKGVSQTGEIELRYKRAPSAGTVQDRP